MLEELLGPCPEMGPFWADEHHHPLASAAAARALAAAPRGFLCRPTLLAVAGFVSGACGVLLGLALSLMLTALWVALSLGASNCFSLLGDRHFVEAALWYALWWIIGAAAASSVTKSKSRAL